MKTHSKRLAAIVLSALMVLSLCTFSVGADGAIEIGTWAQLKAWASATDNNSSNVVLTADITADSADTWTAKANFSAIFDGQGHKISGLSGTQGLFAQTTNATIKNLSIVDSTISGTGSQIGAFIGNAVGYTQMLNCYTNASVYGGTNSIGGFIGHGANTSAFMSFNSCWFDGSVTCAHRYVSGFIGNNESGSAYFADCLSTGTVTSETTNEEPVVGLFAGAAYNGTVRYENCLASAGGVTLSNYADSRGSVFGYRSNTGDKFSNCYAVNGLAVHLYKESGENTAPAGTVSWISASQITASLMGSNWGTKGSQVVPAVFADSYTAPTADVVISTWAELVAWAADASDNQGQTVVLAASIAAPAGSTWTPKATFKGTFDGKGNEIIGLKATGTTNVAFIAQLYGTVRNLSIIEGEFTGTGNVASFAGRAFAGASLQNVYSNAIIRDSGNNAGGIVAQLGGAVSISSAWFDGELNATGQYVSGIVGNQESNALTLTDCLNTGYVTGSNNIAGISEAVYNGSLNATRCVNAGYILKRSNSGSLAQVVAANGTATFVNCRAVTGYALNIMPGDVRGAASSVTGTIGEIASLSALASDSAFSGAWATRPDGLFVPAAFAGKFNTGRVAVSSYAQLLTWRNASVFNDVALYADITVNNATMAAMDATAPSTVWTSKALVSANFNGLGHTISGLYVAASGMFNGEFTGRVANLRIVNSVFKSTSGAISNTSKGATVENVYLNAIVRGTSSSGGFIGTPKSNTKFLGVWFDGDFYGTDMISGIVGNQNGQKVTITDAIASGTINREGTATRTAGISSCVYASTGDFVRCVNLAFCSAPSVSVLNVISGDGAFQQDCYGLSTAMPMVNTNDHRKVSKTVGEGDSAVTKSIAANVKGINPATGEVGDYLGYTIGIDDWAELANYEGITSKWTKNPDGYYVPLVFSDISCASELPGEDALGTIEIGTWAQLTAWATNGSNDFGKLVKLTANITAPSGSSWTAKSEFRGTFDGQGHTISGLTGGTGFITTIWNARIKNLYIKNSTFSGDGQNAVFRNARDYNHITNFYTNATVTSTGYHNGGIVAYMVSTSDTGNSLLKMDSVWFDGSVTADGTYASAIIGNQAFSNAVLNDVLNTGSVTITATGDHVGGISNAVYGGSFVGKRVVNLGRAMNGNGNIQSGIVRTAYVKDFNEGSAGRWRDGYVSIRDSYVLNYNAQSTSNNVWVQCDPLSRIEGIIDASELEYMDSLNGSYNAPWKKNSSGLMVPKYFAGTATSANYSLASSNIINISTYDQLVAWANNLSSDNCRGKLVRLTADIDCNPGKTVEQLKAGDVTNTWTAGASKVFYGTFDGQGHTIRGMYSTTTGLVHNTCGALFANLSISDSVFDFAVSGGNYKGIFVNDVNSGTTTFYNCYTNAYTSVGANVDYGGFTGHINLGNAQGAAAGRHSVTFRNCIYNGEIYAPVVGNSGSSRYIGTFCGNNESSSVSIYDSISAGKMTVANVNGGNGQFAGSIYNGSMIMHNCIAVTDMIGRNLHYFNYYYSKGAIQDFQNLYYYVPEGLEASSDTAPAAAKTQIGPYLKETLNLMEGAYSVEDKGCGEYTMTLSGSTTKATADAYVDKFIADGYTKVYENTLLGDVYLAQLTKGDAVVSINYLYKQSKTLISAIENQPLSTHLKDDFKDTAISGKQNKLHQLQLNANSSSWGDSYVIQLKNGHFIIFDGGLPVELGNLLTYLESLAPSGQIPVVEAWFGTHLHADHTYIISSFNSNPGWAGRLKVEGFYFNEPSDGVKNLDPGVYSEIAAERQAIARLSTTAGTTPEIYRPTIGQRYWFCDVSIDIVNSQEMIPLKSYTGGFNDSSTWYLATIDGKTFLDGGDGHQADMSFLMNTYDYTDLQVDYFSVLHHGSNTWNDFTYWVSCGNASNSSTTAKGFKNLMFPSGNPGTSGANGVLKNHASGSFYYAQDGTDVITFTAVTPVSNTSVSAISVTYTGADEYDVNDALDTTAVTIDVTYTDGTASFTEPLDDFTNVTFTYDFSTAGEQTVTVTYEGFSDTFTVTVNGPAFTYGDLDDSGEIDTVDLTLLRQQIAGTAGIDVNLSAADVNGDSEIDTVDLTLLRQFIAGGVSALGPTA